MLIQRPPGEELLVAGEFSTYLAHPEEPEQDEETVAALVVVGLEDMLTHFLL